MKKINFKLEKNEEIIIDEKNINSIITKNKTTFIINGIKYSYENNIFTRETEEEIIKINFNKKNSIITLKKENISLELNIEVKNIDKKDNKIILKYKIETEDNIINKITIEFI